MASFIIVWHGQGLYGTNVRVGPKGANDGSLRLPRKLRITKRYQDSIHYSVYFCWLLNISLQNQSGNLLTCNAHHMAALTTFAGNFLKPLADIVCEIFKASGFEIFLGIRAYNRRFNHSRLLIPASMTRLQADNSWA